MPRIIGRFGLILTERRTPEGDHDSATGHYFKVGDIVQIVAVHEAQPNRYPPGTAQRVDADGPNHRWHDGEVDGVVRQIVPLDEIQWL